MPNDQTVPVPVPSTSITPSTATVTIMAGNAGDGVSTDALSVAAAAAAASDPLASSDSGPKESKVERKLKRRLKRKQNNERIMNLIQLASTPQELLEVLMEIEEAIPKVYKYSLNEEALPSTADTCAALAVRVYVLDRRIRYDEIKELEKQGMDRQYKPRYHFSPRCLMSSSCTKFLSHAGKCSNDSPLFAGTGSRIPEITETLSHFSTMNNLYLQQRAAITSSLAR